MHKRVFRVSIFVLTVVLLALPFIATAQQSNEQFNSHRIMFTDDNPFGRSEQIARYQIIVEPQMDLANEIRFIEDNSWGYDTNFTIEVIFASKSGPSQAYDRDFPLPRER